MNRSVDSSNTIYKRTLVIIVDNCEYTVKNVELTPYGKPIRMMLINQLGGQMQYFHDYQSQLWCLVIDTHAHAKSTDQNMLKQIAMKYLQIITSEAILK
jgi:hypothetical protein